MRVAPRTFLKKKKRMRKKKKRMEGDRDKDNVCGGEKEEK